MTCYPSSSPCDNPVRGKRAAASAASCSMEGVFRPGGGGAHTGKGGGNHFFCLGSQPRTLPVPFSSPTQKNPHRPGSPRGLFLLLPLFFIRRQSRPGKRTAADTASWSMEGFSARAVGGLTPAKLAETTSFVSAHSPEPFPSPSPPLHKKIPTGLAARGNFFFCYLSF